MFFYFLFHFRTSFSKGRRHEREECRTLFVLETLLEEESSAAEKERRSLFYFCFSVIWVFVAYWAPSARLILYSRVSVIVGVLCVENKKTRKRKKEKSHLWRRRLVWCAALGYADGYRIPGWCAVSPFFFISTTLDFMNNSLIIDKTHSE